jgi:hypothetical protein
MSNDKISKKKNQRTTAIQNRINMLYKRYTDDLIGASTLPAGLSLIVAKKGK